MFPSKLRTISEKFFGTGIEIMAYEIIFSVVLIFNHLLLFFYLSFIFT